MTLVLNTVSALALTMHYRVITLGFSIATTLEFLVGEKRHLAGNEPVCIAFNV